MKILLFDYDGTIVNSMDSVYKGFNHAARVFKMPQRTKAQVGRLYLNNIFVSLLKIGVPKARLDEFMDQMREGYSNYKVKPFLKMREIIKELRNNNKVIIITSNYKKTIEQSLSTNKIKVDAVFGKEQGLSKVEKINKIKKKYPKNEILYIGDTVGDIKESRQAGVKSIAVAWGYNSKKDLINSKPDYLINKPQDLLKILE